MNRQLNYKVKISSSSELMKFLLGEGWEPPNYSTGLSNCYTGYGLLFHMTQPTSRSTIKVIA